MRKFTTESNLENGNLALALAPALTPYGIDDNPNFFKGLVLYPQVFARCLLVLADVTSTRYYNYTPVAQRDPVITAQREMLRAECFSACNGVYARLDLSDDGFDGDIDYGTTNVDIGMNLRVALSQVKQTDKLHLTIGDGGLSATPFEKEEQNIFRIRKIVRERPVQMPDRWVRAFGNVAEIHQSMRPYFQLKGAQAQAFIASLPPATGKNQTGWLSPKAVGATLTSRRTASAVYIPGLHRLSALKRVMTNVTEILFYMRSIEDHGHFMMVAQLPGMRLTISLTAEAWQGYSGEGSLLSALAKEDIIDYSEDIISELSFDPFITESRIARRWKMDKNSTQDALSLLAVSGKLGYDTYEGAYFHRELPDDSSRVLKDNPRLVAARKLLDDVKPMGANRWIVHSGEIDYRVTFNLKEPIEDAKCTCSWYLRHRNERGPCKHILAVQLKEEQQ